MKHFLQIAFFATTLFSISFSQTFSGSNGTYVNLSSAQNITINVSGVAAGKKLIQVNLRFGDGTSSYSASIEGANIVLKNPGNAVQKNLITTTSLGGSSDIKLKYFNIHLRDHAALKTPKAASGANDSREGYPYNYGYYAPAETWAAFNSSTINGAWTLSINAIGSTTYQRKFDKVELVFGDDYPVIDVRGGAGTPNQSCATKQCLQTGSIYWGKNTGYASQSSPPQTVDGCFWNADNNNKSWYYFVASATTAQISISGFSTSQQSVVVKLSACGGTSTLVTGGCMSSMYSINTLSNIKYYQEYNPYSAGNGERRNHSYSLSGLTAGNWYALVIEGSSNANSEFYIEISSGASGGCSPLPIELLDFKAKPEESGVKINWETATERDNDYFTVLRSSDLINWEPIGTIAGSGNTTSKIDYEFIDIDPLDGASYYQLKQTDYNGADEAFDPVSVFYKKKHRGNSIVVFPNPAKDDFEVKIHAKGCEHAVMQIHDLSGKIVLDKVLKLQTGPDKIHVENSGLEKGVYVVKVFFDDGGSCATKLVVE